MQDNQFQILIVFLLYGLIVYFIAIWSVRNTKNISDYILAGRKLSGPITALGAGASDMSGWLLMALPGAVYLTGISFIWLPVALSIGAYLNWTFVSKRLRVYTEVAKNSLTIPEFLDNRFKSNDKKLRVVSALAIIIFFTMYAVSGFISAAILTDMIFHLGYKTSLFISAAIIVVYTMIGGFLAVSRIDFFQGILMLFALMFVPIMAIQYLGGVDAGITDIAAISKDKLDVFKNITTIGIISLAAWGLGYFGQPHILVRFMAVRSIKELPIARLICMTWMILSLIGAVLVGMIGIVFFANPVLTNHETVFIDLSGKLFNPWLQGILLSAIVSAIMSTIAALILMSGSALVEDFYRAFIRKKATNKEYLLASRIAVLLVALVAIFIAANPTLTILSVVGFAWSGLGASFGAVILFSLYWKRMTKQGAMAGVIAGGATVIVWELLAKYVGSFFASPDILSGFSLLPGYILSSLAIIFVSLNTKKPSGEVINDFNETIKRLK